MDIILAICIAVACLVVGFVLGYVVFNMIITQKKEQILKDAEIEGEAIKKSKQLEVKRWKTPQITLKTY